MTSATVARFDPAALRAFVARAFETVGMPRDDARAVAELMVSADLGGADAHGVFRVPQYVRRIRAGGINLRPQIRVERERAATALVDGDNGMGHLVTRFAVDVAIAKAKKTGVAWVGVHRSNHAGPASLYARMALAHDMIGLYFAVGNANHLAPWGGIDLMLSTNPIAVAIPAQEEPPIVLDMASSVAAYGKVKAKLQRGESMPEGWMIDRNGNPLTDPARAGEGLMLPIGGYKGYGLALVVGLLAGTLNGAANGPGTIDFNADQRTPTNTGHAIAAIAIDAFADVATFRRDVDALIRALRGSRRLPGVDRIYVPGEQSHEKRVAYERDGIPLAPALVRALNELAAELAIDPLS